MSILYINMQLYADSDESDDDLRVAVFTLE